MANEMEELRGDIGMHLDSDTAKAVHVEYWKALLAVCDWELAEARKRAAVDRARVRGEEPSAELLAGERSVHSSVKADVRAYLQKESYRESEGMHAGVEARLRSGAAKAVEYWPVTLQLVRIDKARALLKEFHAKTSREHQQPADAVDESETANVDEGLMSPEPEEVVMESAEEAGSFSPQLLHHGDGMEGAVDPEEDRGAEEKGGAGRSAKTDARSYVAKASCASR